MNEFIQKLIGQIKELWDRFSPAQRATLIGAPIALLIVLLAGAWWAVQPSWRILLANVDPQKAAEIIERLQEDGVPYRLSRGGSVIEVPADRKSRLRMSLASEGFLHAGGEKGWEMFDLADWNMTEEGFRVKYLRALQGELERDIWSIPQVSACSVHVVEKKESLFEWENESAKASVKLTLRGPLAPSQTEGIANLVAASVEGLMPENVTILDGHGNMLKGGHGDSEVRLSSTQLETQRARARDFEKDAQSILDRVLGPGRSMVKVGLELDFDRVEKTTKDVDPDRTVVVTEDKTTRDHTSSGSSGVGGASDTDAKLGSQAGTMGGTHSNTKDKENRTTYAFTETETHTKKVPGTEIKRMTVAVAVDYRYEETGQDGEIVRTAVVRSPAELKEYEGLVKQAVGFDETRDAGGFHIACVQFDGLPVVEAGVAPTRILKVGDVGSALGIAKYVASVVALLIVTVFLWVSFRRSKETEEGKELERGRQFSKEAGLLSREYSSEELGLGEIGDISHLPPEEQRKRKIMEKVSSLAQSQPGSAANIVQRWLVD